MIFNFCLCFAIIILYFFSHLVCKEKKYKDSIFLILVFLILFILVGSREMTRGNDTMEYIRIFKECGIKGISFFNYNTYYERGYLLFNILVFQFFDKPRIFLYILSFIFNYSVYKFIKDNSKNYLASVLMYITLLFFYQSMSMMRQFFSLSIVLLSFRLVKNRKLFLYIIMIFIASLFHSTAWLALLIYPMYYLKYTRKRVAIIIIFSFIVFIGINEVYPLVSSLLNRSTYYSSMIGNKNFGNFISTLIYLVIYVFSMHVIKNGSIEKNGFYLYSFIFTMAIFLISINMAVLSRASQYFSILSIVALPNLIEENVTKNKLFYNMIIFFCFFAYSSCIMIFRPEWNSAYNYKTCIFEKAGYICE